MIKDPPLRVGNKKNNDEESSRGGGIERSKKQNGIGKCKWGSLT